AVPPEVTGGLDTVGIRMPDHPVALALIRAAGAPIAAPSANTSGRPSPTAAGHGLEDLAGCIPGIMAGGARGVGVGATGPDGSTCWRTWRGAFPSSWTAGRPASAWSPRCWT